MHMHPPVGAVRMRRFPRLIPNLGLEQTEQTGSNVSNAQSSNCFSAQFGAESANGVMEQDSEALGAEQQFNLEACGNLGRLISVEWDHIQRSFRGGFGLCTPCRWKLGKSC